MYYIEHIIQALNKVPRLWSLQTWMQHLGSVTEVKYQDFAQLFEKNYKLDNKTVSIHMCNVILDIFAHKFIHQPPQNPNIKNYILLYFEVSVTHISSGSHDKIMCITGRSYRSHIKACLAHFCIIHLWLFGHSFARCPACPHLRQFPVKDLT